MEDILKQLDQTTFLKLMVGLELLKSSKTKQEALNYKNIIADTLKDAGIQFDDDLNAENICGFKKHLNGGI